MDNDDKDYSIPLGDSPLECVHKDKVNHPFTNTLNDEL